MGNITMIPVPSLMEKVFVTLVEMVNTLIKVRTDSTNRLLVASMSFSFQMESFEFGVESQRWGESTFQTKILSSQGWEVQGISMMQTLNLEPIFYFLGVQTLNLKPIIFFWKFEP
jgi:hypothetical protein